VDKLNIWSLLVVVLAVVLQHHLLAQVVAAQVV
jgi:hypothetical protein